MAVYAVVMSVGFMVAFPAGRRARAGERLARRRGRRSASCLVVGLAPLAWLLDRSSPEAIGLEVDGGGASAETPRRATRPQATLGEALRSPAFWVFALASSVYGLVASGIGLFNESILAERGFAPDVYYTALAVTAITGLAGNFAAGAFADRGSLRHVLVAALLILTGGLAALAHVTTVGAGHGAGGGDGHRRRLRHGRLLQLLGTRLRAARISGASRAPRRR